MFQTSYIAYSDKQVKNHDCHDEVENLQKIRQIIVPAIMLM